MNRLLQSLVACVVLSSCGTADQFKGESGSGDVKKSSAAAPGKNTVAQKDLNTPDENRPAVGRPSVSQRPLDDYPASSVGDALTLRQLLAAQNVGPLTDDQFRKHSPAKVKLGQLLFFDRILSGNKTTSCASCHLFDRGSSDNFAMNIDAATRGMVRRSLNPKSTDFVPRNTTAISNIGHKSFTAMFHDSRVAVDGQHPSGFSTPAGDLTPHGLDSVVAAQALFPLLTDIEMLGEAGENELAGLESPTAIWNGLLRRVMAYPEYRSLFYDAYPLERSYGIQHLANAIAAFEETVFRADHSQFDAFLRGSDRSMSPMQLQGAILFYGKSQCSNCHAGALQASNQHFAIAIPQFGPGKGHGINGLEDFGRGGITGRAEDMYKFRVPSLRNIVLSAPYGHNGAFTQLDTYIRHYRNPVASMTNWNPAQVRLPTAKFPTDFFTAALNPAIRANLAQANQIPGIPIDDQELQALKSFMTALTDDRFNSRSVRPLRVPSGKRDFLGLVPNFDFPLNRQSIFTMIPADLNMGFFD